jgi:hypothetical protein
MGELLMVALIVFVVAPSVWSGACLGFVVLAGGLHSWVGWSLYSAGRAGMQDGRNHPFRTLREYRRSRIEGGRSPFLFYVLGAVWCFLVASAVGVLYHQVK